MKKIITKVAVIVASCSLLGSCYHPDPYVQEGRAVGTVVGGITGAVIGNNISGGNSWGGAAIGAALGGLAGDSYGKRNSMYYHSRPYYRSGYHSYRRPYGYRYY